MHGQKISRPEAALRSGRAMNSKWSGGGGKAPARFRLRGPGAVRERKRRFGRARYGCNEPHSTHTHPQSSGEEWRSGEGVRPLLQSLYPMGPAGLGVSVPCANSLGSGRPSSPAIRKFLLKAGFVPEYLYPPAGESAVEAGLLALQVSQRSEAHGAFPH